MGLYEKLASAIPKVTALRCPKCGNTRQTSRSQIAGFFADGWPRCCGYTMYMHTETDPLPAQQEETHEKD